MTKTYSESVDAQRSRVMTYEELVRRIGHAQKGSGRLVVSPEDMWTLRHVMDGQGRPVVTEGGPSGPPTPTRLGVIGSVLGADVRLLPDGDFEIKVVERDRPTVRGWDYI